MTTFVIVAILCHMYVFVGVCHALLCRHEIFEDVASDDVVPDQYKPRMLFFLTLGYIWTWPRFALARLLDWFADR